MPRSDEHVSPLRSQIRKSFSEWREANQQEYRDSHAGMSPYELLVSSAKDPGNSELRDMLIADIRENAPIGSMQLPKDAMKNLLRVTGGVNLAQVSPREGAMALRRMGPSLRTKSIEALGAQLRDQHGDDLPLAIERRLRQSVSDDLLPTLVHEVPERSEELARFSPASNKIVISPAMYDYADELQHGKDFAFGVGGHEAEHASQALQETLDPTELAIRQFEEVLGLKAERPFPRPATNADLEDYASGGLQRALTYMQGNPYDVLKKLPPDLRSALEEGIPARGIEKFLYPDSLKMSDIQEAPKVLRNIAKNAKMTRAGLWDVVRTAEGNVGPRGGFVGTDPYLTEILNTGRHFEEPILTNMDIPAKYLGIQHAERGLDVHPDWVKRFPEIRRALKEYKSNVVPVQWEPVPPPPPGLPFKD